MYKNHSIWLAVSLAYLLSSAANAADNAITWSEKFYNPQPAPAAQPADLILPMPCDGAMTFRPVDIPAADWLDDQPVELGDSDSERGYKEGRRLSYIAGSFSDRNKAARLYYIGKYEVTRDQYAAVMDKDCPQVGMRGRQPITGMSWFDAVAFARQFTEWLLTHARDALPHEDQEPGFLRLPTEEEWEFAARGGLAVDAADFLATRFIMPDGELADYAWYESSGSAGGKLRPTGLLKPNPLGLHDILGNAAELTLSPFRLDRHGRTHGQAGGFVSRGGDIFTPEMQLGAAWRQEHNYFDANSGRAKSLDSLGFRLLLTAPVIVSNERLNAIKDSWKDLPVMAGTTGVDAMQALTQLKTLSLQTPDSVMRTRLEIIQRDLEQSQSAINEARQRALRALLRTGAFMGKRVVTDIKRAEVLKQLQKMAQDRFEDLRDRVKNDPEGRRLLDQARAKLEEKQTNWQESMQEIETSLANSVGYYADMTVNVGMDYLDTEINTQQPVVEAELTAKHNTYLIPYLRVFVTHLQAYHQTRAVDKTVWQQELLHAEPVSP